MTKYLFAALWLCLGALLSAQESAVFFAEQPALSPDGQTIYFSYDTDIWRVPAAGGPATRVTAMDGIETRPRVSPDGKWLAFSSNQFGSTDVFVVPVAGGEVQRLSWHESFDNVECWSWDSQTVYFTSGRYNSISTYTVPLKGGTPQRLFEHYFNTVHNPAVHPQTGEIYFNESWESNHMAHRKGYKGAFNPDIKSWNPKTREFKVHTDYIGKDFNAVIDRQGNVYFLSDEHNGEYNLYTFRQGKKTRLTNFNTSIRQLNVSADGSALVFQRDYQIHRYDVKAGKTDRVDIRVARNLTLAQPQDFKTAGNITAFDISPDGKKIAFISRGELFVSDIKGKFVQQLPTRAEGRVLEVWWLKDNKTVLYNQTMNGYQNWFSMAADGSAPEKQHTADNRNNRLLSLNSDKTKAVYLSGRDELRLLDLETFQSSLLVKDEFWAIQNDAPQFGPDDRHVLFTAYRNFERDVLVVDVETRQIRNLTNTAVTEAGPVWSPDGKAVYFNSNRTQPSYPYGLRDPDVFRMPLNTVTERPFRSDKFAELFAEPDTSKAAKDKKKEKPVITVADADLMKYMESAGPVFGTQNILHVSQKDDKTTVLMLSNHERGRNALWKIVTEPFAETKIEKVAEGFVTNIREVDGKFYAYLGGNIHTLDLGGNKTEKIDINYTFRRNLQDEFRQMFFETWANMEENFYDETFHGINWPAMRDRYAAWLPHVNTRADLRRLTNDMLGELNTSHFGFNSGGEEETIFYKTRSLGTGIEFEDNAPYRVRRLVTDGPAARNAAPLLPGDVLTHVNGQAVDPAINREMYFSQPSLDEELTLRFRRGEERVEIKLQPQSYFDIRDLLYDEWEAECQRQVDERSRKRIAYVHMKDMGTGELNRFLREMVSEGAYRDGLILDLRWNTGGNVHDEVLRFLSQRPYLQWKYREGQLTQQSNFGPAAKPIVLLINEQSLSDAEMTAEGFKTLKLGKIIGTETYRWIIFTSGKGLVDGSFYRLPSWGCYTLDGKNLEKIGVAPDISVKNTFKDRLEGKDPQLDRAIEEVLKQMKG
ncbi:MAG: PD40 domain-containing protein [Saprospiraceae bacterium]|nr:PD40 domain-containing protein [Saprospiraceae bacterium]